MKDGRGNELLRYAGTFDPVVPIDFVTASASYTWRTDQGASYDLDMRSMTVSTFSYEAYREVIAEEVLKESFDGMSCPDTARDCLVLEEEYYQGDEVPVFANGIRAEFDYYLDTQGGTRNGFTLELGGRYISMYTKPNASGAYVLYTCPLQQYDDDYCATSDEVVVMSDASAFVGSWRTAVIEYDMQTHKYTLDLDGDGVPEYTHRFPFAFAERNTTARVWGYSWNDTGTGRLLLDEVRIDVLE